MGLIGSYGVFRQVLNHVTVPVKEIGAKNAPAAPVLLRRLYRPLARGVAADATRTWLLMSLVRGGGEEGVSGASPPPELMLPVVWVVWSTTASAVMQSTQGGAIPAQHSTAQHSAAQRSAARHSVSTLTPPFHGPDVWLDALSVLTAQHSAAGSHSTAQTKVKSASAHTPSCRACSIITR